MEFISTPRGMLWQYDVKGEGEALVFLHGMGVNSKLWAQQREYFSRKYRVILIDLPGHGKTEWRGLDLDDMAYDVHYILGYLGLESANMVASSFGGLVMLNLEHYYFGYVDRMVFVGSLPKFARSPEYPCGLDVERIRKLSEQFDGDYVHMMNIFFRSLFTREERESPRFQWVKQFRSDSDVPPREALKHFLDILEKEDLTGILKKTTCPVQFINGSGDYICPAEHLDFLRTLQPRARFDVIEGCGHFPFLSKPDEFNAALEQFLAVPV